MPVPPATRLCGRNNGVPRKRLKGTLYEGFMFRIAPTSVGEAPRKPCRMQGFPLGSVKAFPWDPSKGSKARLEKREDTERQQSQGHQSNQQRPKRTVRSRKEQQVWALYGGGIVGDGSDDQVGPKEEDEKSSRQVAEGPGRLGYHLSAVV